MEVVIDIEANGLNPDTVWCTVCLDTETDTVYEFEKVSEDPSSFLLFCRGVHRWVGHNILSYDGPVLRRLLGGHHLASHGGRSVLPTDDNCTDTLVVSRFLNVGIPGGHSLEAWGSRLGITKVGTDIADWSVYDPSMLSRCVSDVSINVAVYRHQLPYLRRDEYKSAIDIEHKTAVFCRTLHENGFDFDYDGARLLKDTLSNRLKEIDDSLISSFPSSVVLLKEFIPEVTQTGTLKLKDFRWLPKDIYSKDLTFFKEGIEYSVISLVPFNPGSLQQIIDRLWEAGWKPTEKTKGHSEFLKSRDSDPDKKARYERYGWKVSEENLLTLPETAPEAAQRLVERILIASRISDLEEWLAAAVPTSEGRWRIHGWFTPIGGWTQRMAHSNPNMANIPKSKPSDKETPLDKLSNSINDQMRSFWRPSPGKVLVGTDAAGIQMCVFGHYVNDKRLIESLVKGDKKLGTDIHSLNRKALGEPCKSRDDAKTFIYAWLLGAGIPKIAEILRCSIAEAKRAAADFLEFYPGLKDLKETRIPADARRGYFYGLDNRPVICDNAHKMLAGYLQNGETLIMKYASQVWNSRLTMEGIPYLWVNFVHDEWQTETDEEYAEYVGQVQQDAIAQAGVLLNMNCPLSGETKIGMNWKETH